MFARSHSVASLMYSHFQWKDDAIVVTLPRHKGDQEGVRIYPIHVYANPLDPMVCPILSLAIYVFCMAYHRDGDGNHWKLLNGSSIESKFSSWLQDCLRNGHVDVAEVGGTPS